MATVRPGMFPVLPHDPARVGEVVSVEIPGHHPQPRVRIVASMEEEAGPSLSDAEVIVTAGRGINHETDLGRLQELANLLGGMVGATRAVTDLGWMPENVMIGQTGATVAPRLYIGCGVSGAMPHVVGMKGADIIVAINKDPKAPIFDIATFGLEGDLQKILPLLIQRIRKEKHL
jgi:electron transfer flavoprotein alpha subunit